MVYTEKMMIKFRADLKDELVVVKVWRSLLLFVTEKSGEPDSQICNHSLLLSVYLNRADAVVHYNECHTKRKSNALYAIQVIEQLSFYTFFVLNLNLLQCFQTVASSQIPT